MNSWVSHAELQPVLSFRSPGKLMGLAMRTKCLLSLDLPSIVWKVGLRNATMLDFWYKALVNHEMTAEDVLAIDRLAFKILDDLKAIENQVGGADLLNLAQCLIYSVCSLA